MTAIKPGAQRNPVKLRGEPTEIPVKQPETKEAEAAKNQGVMLPSQEEQYEQALSVEQKLLAASMGIASPKSLAHTQKLEMVLVRELSKGEGSALAQLIKANGPALQLQLQAMAAGVSQKELRQTVNFSANQLLQKGDTEGYNELVDCARGLDSAKNLIEEYDRALREMPRQTRPQGAEVHPDLSYGLERYLYGMVDGLADSAMSTMPGMIDAFGAYPYADAEMAYGLNDQLMQAQAGLADLSGVMTQGPHDLEGYYYTNALDCMQLAGLALQQAQAFMMEMGSVKAAAQGAVSPNQMQATLERLVGEPLKIKKGSDGSYRVANAPLVRTEGKDGSYIQRQLSTKAASEDEALARAYRKYTTLPDNAKVVMPTWDDDRRIDVYKRFDAEQQIWAEVGRSKPVDRPKPSRSALAESPVNKILAKGEVHHLAPAEGKFGPKFALKVGQETLSLSHTKSGKLSWRVRGDSAGNAEGVAKGIVDDKMAGLILARLQDPYSVADNVQHQQGDLSKLFSILEPLAR